MEGAEGAHLNRVDLGLLNAQLLALPLGLVQRREQLVQVRLRRQVHVGEATTLSLVVLDDLDAEDIAWGQGRARGGDEEKEGNSTER